SLRSQLETQKTQFLNEIDRLSREYNYADHMNAILGVYTELDEVTILQCDYLELLEKCEGLETELSKSKMIPQLKSNLMGDRVMRNNSQGKKQEVEDQRKNVKLPKNKTSVTACNDSLYAKTLNVNFVSAMRSTVSNTPLSSNSFAARKDCPIYRQLWVLKAHDGKSQAST
nr:hypothetical protein [Tanacetum cinerariifolium]